MQALINIQTKPATQIILAQATRLYRVLISARCLLRGGRTPVYTPYYVEETEMYAGSYDSAQAQAENLVWEIFPIGAAGYAWTDFTILVNAVVDPREERARLDSAIQCLNARARARKSQ